MFVEQSRLSHSKCCLHNFQNFLLVKIKIQNIFPLHTLNAKVLTLTFLSYEVFAFRLCNPFHEELCICHIATNLDTFLLEPLQQQCWVCVTNWQEQRRKFICYLFVLILDMKDQKLVRDNKNYWNNMYLKNYSRSLD